MEAHHEWQNKKKVATGRQIRDPVQYTTMREKSSWKVAQFPVKKIDK